MSLLASARCLTAVNFSPAGDRPDGVVRTGFRLALNHPERISAIISQNGNAYGDGLSDGWSPIPPKFAHGVLGKYVKLVGSAANGAVCT